MPSALSKRGLPERSAWGVHKALRAVLNYAVRVELLAKNPAAAVPEPGAEASRGSDLRVHR